MFGTAVNTAFTPRAIGVPFTEVNKTTHPLVPRFKVNVPKYVRVGRGVGPVFVADGGAGFGGFEPSGVIRKTKYLALSADSVKAPFLIFPVA
jgi:hypothetical protein